MTLWVGALKQVQRTDFWFFAGGNVLRRFLDKENSWDKC